MRLPALPRHAVLGGAVAATLVAGAVLTAASAAVATSGCVTNDPPGDASVLDQDGAPDGDVDIASFAVAGDATGLTAVMKVVALQDYTTSIFFGDAHDISFTALGKDVTLASSRYYDPIADVYAPTSSLVVDGATATAASYKVAYDVKASTISYSVSLADLKTALGGDPSSGFLTALSAEARAKTTPEDGSDLSSDDAAAAEGVAYRYGTTGCSKAPAPTAAPTAAPSASASPKPSATATPAPSSTASPVPTASASPSASATAGSGTQMVISGAVRVQFGDAFTSLVTLKDSSGAPLSGKRVTAQHGSAPAVAGTTNSSGQVRLRTPARDRAGTRDMVVRFAGDSSAPARTVRRRITTVNEVTKLQRTVSGSGSTRTVTVRLVEDDPTTKVLAGRNVIFQFSGRTITVRTDSSGRARVTAGTGAAMDITFTGETGRYAPAKLRTYAR